MLLNKPSFVSSTFIPTSVPLLDGNEKKYVIDALDSNWISADGKYTKLLEDNFADFLGVRHAITCSNGTTAIHLALLALGIGAGDEVIMPDFTIICSASMTILTGAKPVLVDVDSYWCIDPQKIEKKITSRTKAIMAVHMYGNPANMEKIMEIAKKHKLYVVEDACAAHGAEINGKKVGSIGDVGCFSFYASKNITSGEGGMVVTNSDKLAQKVRLLKNQAFEKPRFIHRALGFNYRLTDVQAAICFAQLENIEKKVRRKREIARNYSLLLENVPVEVSKDPPWGKSVFWMYCILIKKSFGRKRDEIIQLLAERGIGSERFYTPMSLQPVFLKGSDKRYPNVYESFSKSKDIAARGLYLPTGLSLDKDTQKKIVETLLSLIK